MPSPSSRTPFAWLLAKEWRELVAARSWWVLLVLIGPLVGVSFISAVRTYGEASGLNGTAAGVGEAFSPLVGIWAPTFSACELAAAFLLPFVGIRLFGGDQHTGALKIEIQQGMPSLARISAKALVLLAAWLIASAAPLLAVVLWKIYGGRVYPPELASVILGHLLNAGLSVSLAAAAASVTEHPATAAIVTLAVTVGTWVVNFVAAVQGGLWARVAEYTPTAMVAEFQHGLIRLDVLLIALALVATGLSVAAIWSRPGIAVWRRGWESVALGTLAGVVIVGCSFAGASWDTSESRANSFPEADERVLRQIAAPLSIEAHLAPEDPRRFDLEHRALAKLRRVLPHLQVRYISATSIGLFEQSAEHYGEIVYDLGGRKTVSRVTTAEGVLETIYALAGIAPPAEEGDAVYRGYPLAAAPTGAAAVFYGLWPAAIAAGALTTRRRQ